MKLSPLHSFALFFALSCAGDVDGDGLSDLLIGAPADSGYNDRYGGAMLITSGQLIEHALP